MKSFSFNRDKDGLRRAAQRSCPHKQVLRGCAILALAATFVFSSLPVAADHVQEEPNGTTVQFDHDGDNEWWVEVLTRSTGGSVVAMEVRAESSSTYRGLQNKATIDGWTKWGPEQAFRIPSGDRVIFRAHTVDSTGAAATVDSCFFTHPAGVEQCSSTPPTSWEVTQIGEAGIASHSGDMAVSDADNDGRRDVTIGTRNGVYTFEKNAGAWSGQRVGTSTAIGAVAAGNGDGIAGKEIYAMSDNVLVRYRFVDGVWVERPLLTFPESFAGDMTLGNIDGQTKREIYVGMFDTTCNPETQLCSSSSQIYHVRSANGVWTSTPIASLSGSVDSMWIGDGDRDGDAELYVGHGTRHADRTTQVQKVGSAWEANDLPGRGSESGFSLVVAGDGDRDGRGEVYTLNYEGLLRKITHGSSGWTESELFSSLMTPEGTRLFPQTLVLGDGDGDGSQELYIGTDRGEVYQVRFTDGVWKATRIAAFTDVERGPGGSGLMAVGNGDDAKGKELYAGVSFREAGPGDEGVTRVYQVKAASSSFDASFRTPGGNEWWVEVYAEANGPIAGVDARDDGGAWVALEEKSWGAWAKSFHVEDGSVVEFRARSADGGTDISDRYRWPAGTPA